MATNIPIGITLPIRSGQTSGYFEQSTDTFTAYRTNIINLIRTVPGERRMNPTFGCSLWKIVFEPNDDFITDKVSRAIKEDVARWIPGVTVNSVEVKYFENDTSVNLKDIYKLYVAVQFTIDSINQSETINMALDTSKI